MEFASDTKVGERDGQWMCLRFRLSFTGTWADGRSWLARALWNSAMRRVRLHTWQGMPPRRGRVPLTQHLSDHTCSMHTCIQFCVHTSPQYKRDVDKTEQVQHKAATMSGSGRVPRKRKKIHGGLAVCSYQLTDCEEEGRTTGCGHN